MPKLMPWDEETARRLPTARCVPRFGIGRLPIKTGHMRLKVGALPLLLAGFLLASCASPRGLDEAPLQMPALKPGFGRVYFTRPAELVGSAIQPEIRMNNEVVG
ncbi:hypothetical protein KXV85_002187, partial [Aspergillus fumigatus]